MPESGPSTEINSRQNSNDKDFERRTTKKYSIYNDNDFFPIKEISKYGQIIFSLYYDWISKTLEVTVNHAKYLMGFGTKRKNHFYVKVLLKTKSCPQYTSTNSLSGVLDKNINKFQKSLKGSFRTAIKSDFCNPVFDETFKFTNITSLLLKECILQMIVKEETPKFLEKNIVLGCVDFALDEAQLIDKHESLNEIIRDIKPIGQIEDKGKVILSLQYNRQLTVLTVYVKELLSWP
uniref:Synaptotagmin XV-like protein n=1 Tax=Schmidtea mediterranea TaxID=79327 RepID=A0A1W6I193_SCHMD|nr:synaptotagmin XV-like protein [Schmidtea mediterranea]